MNFDSSPGEKASGLKITVFQFVVATALLWLLSGFWRIQIREAAFYQGQAKRNHIKSLRLTAPRGKIMDREGRILVDNQLSFHVLLSRSMLEPDNLPLIAQGLRLPLDTLKKKLGFQETDRLSAYSSVILKKNLMPTEVFFWESHRGQFPEVELLRVQKRLYAQEGLASHVIGYTGEISDAELKSSEFQGRNPGSDIGKAGIERQYDDALSGTDGRRLIVVDGLGHERRIIGEVKAVPGRDIRLTLDLDLQVVADLAMENRIGAVAALDPRNGEVLALVSKPSYFPGRFLNGIRRQDWRALTQHPDKPLLHRAIQAQLAPGSIFKPVIALAARRQGVIDGEFSAVCRGGAVFYNRYFRCHRVGGHGRVTLYEAMAQSCDVFFYTLGKRLGIDPIAEYARLVGLGAPTGIDLPYEKRGLVPSTGWKLRFLREKWYPGETISVAIGQGALTVTPLQIARAIGGLAAGGEWHRPHLISWDGRKALVEGFEPPPPERAALDPAILSQIVRGLWGVVNGGGTGVRARLPGYEVCGKTGTAQVVSLRRQRESGEEAHKDNAWFVGFAPCRDPEIVVAALIERGEHGYIAAPVVRDVIKAHFDKQARLRDGEPLAEPVQSAETRSERRRE